MPASYPILEFDPSPEAIINPFLPPLSEPAPDKAVFCFFLDVIHHLVAEGKLRKIGAGGSEMGPNPIYLMEYEGQRFIVYHPGVGAALAAGLTDEIISTGVNKIIVCGGCGALVKDIVAGHAVIVNSAVRDEGTSYHYAVPSREINASPRAIQALEDTLQMHNVPYQVGKSWTTDGFYRETSAKREQRIAEGCCVVEMEASAFFAVAQFRNIELGLIVYGGDLVIPEGWDNRMWQDRKDIRQALFWLAVEACARL